MKMTGDGWATENESPVCYWCFMRIRWSYRLKSFLRHLV